MSQTFRELLRKVGSGTHTSKSLTQLESAEATRMMLQQVATPAQIGAFMISQRIKRPTGEELAGILDAYAELGPHLAPISHRHRVTVLNSPYDGRSRTAPVSVLVAVVLATADCPVVMHGGDRIPTKYGIPLVQVWQGLGIDWSGLSLPQVQQVLASQGVGFVYLPRHFPLAQDMVQYREEIGKRPPFATAELFWSPYDGAAQVVVGYVHPPTEGLAEKTFQLRGTERFISVKGLEGSCDLPRDRTAIIGIGDRQVSPSIERLLLHPRDYGLDGTDVPLDEAILVAEMEAILAGQSNELRRSLVWNAGFYLWMAGAASQLDEGLTLADQLLSSGAVARYVAQLQQTVRSLSAPACNPAPIGS